MLKDMPSWAHGRYKVAAGQDINRFVVKERFLLFWFTHTNGRETKIQYDSIESAKIAIEKAIKIEEDHRATKEWRKAFRSIIYP